LKILNADPFTGLCGVLPMMGEEDGGDSGE
jgi:hypothetical protein